MNMRSKPPNVFGQVLGAILVAAAIGAIIFGIWALRSQADATAKAYNELQRENARTDLYLSLLKTPSREPPSPASSAQTPQQTYSLTITRPVELKDSVGRVIAKLEQGRSVQYVGRDNYVARVRFDGREYEIPISSTDLK